MQKQNTIIHPLKKRDIEATIKLYKISLQDNKKGFIQDIDFRKNIQNMIKELRTNNGDIYSLKLDNQIIGMGALKKVNEHKVEICRLHLCPNLKGQGLGKIFTLALIAFAKEKNYTTINLHVTRTQKAAIGLYEKLEFYEYKPSSIYKIVYKGKELSFDTLYMERKIKEFSLCMAYSLGA